MYLFVCCEYANPWGGEMCYGIFQGTFLLAIVGHIGTATIELVFDASHVQFGTGENVCKYSSTATDSSCRAIFG